MHAQLIEGGTTPARRATMDRIVTEQLVPALEQEPGYAGALNLTDAPTGDAMMIVLWEDEAQALRPLDQYGPAFLKALANIAGISTGTRRPISTWKVNCDDRVSPTTSAQLVEDNKLIASRWLELVSQDKVEELCELTHSTWTMHGGPPGLPAGPDGVRALMRAIGPVQQTWTIDDIVAAGDKVAVRATNHCVQESFFGVSGKGRRQVFTATFIHRIADGKVRETWRNADDLGRLLQLDALITERDMPDAVAPEPAGISASDLDR